MNIQNVNVNDNNVDESTETSEQTSVQPDALNNEFEGKSVEELMEIASKNAKAYQDQAQYNKKLKQELESYKASTDNQEATKEDKADAPKPKADPVSETVVPTSEEIRLIQKGLTDEEIEEAKRFAKAFDKGLLEVVDSNPFQTRLNELRESQKSKEVNLDNLNSPNVHMSDDDFFRKVTDGIIDISNESHQERYKKILAKRLRA